MMFLVEVSMVSRCFRERMEGGGGGEGGEGGEEVKAEAQVGKGMR